jgi:geranylgeranyl reductase family protein
MNNVCIIGAGPAGLETAMALWDEGFDSVVFEEHPEIGLPEHCTGLVSKKGCEELGLPTTSCLQNKIFGAKIFSPNGQSIEVRRAEPVAYVLNRAELDTALLRMARTRNIHVAIGTKLLDVRNNTLFVEANGRGELRKSNIIVGADGANSVVRHLVGIKTDKSNFVHTVQSTCKGNFDDKMVEVHLGNYAKGFFGWVVPIDKHHAKIGLGCSLGENVSYNFSEFIRTKLPEVTVGEINSALIPCGPPLKEAHKNNLMLVGDSAFHTKATTGGGIVYGMRAAKILAQTLADSFKKKVSADEYEKRLEPLNKELRLHWKIRRYLNSLSDKEIDSIMKKLKQNKIENFLNENGDMDDVSLFAGKLAANPSYWLMAGTLLDFLRTPDN